MISDFYFEKPIDTTEDDNYDFDKHAVRISETLLQMPLHESYTLTINGEWGSGKTSFVNLIIKHLKDAIELDNEKIIIINFDTSLFQNSKEMISEYFKQVFSILNKEKKINKSTDFNKLVKSFILYGDKISLSIETISNDNNFLVRTWKKIKSIYEIWVGKEDSKLTLQEAKDKLSELLLKSKYRFIVIIDDMDRLPKKQVKHIFQLIYSLCKLPNHTFILPFDKKIVANCINDVYGIENGETYIEKIIQREIPVPEISEVKVKNNIFKTVANAGIEIDFSEKEYIELGYSICIKPLIKNIRDLNRLSDNFIFVSNLTKDKINQFDLLILTSIKMKLPDLYRYISDNRYRVTLDDKEEALENIERKDWGKLSTELSNYKIFDSTQIIAKRILDFLFPNFYLNYQGKREENILIGTHAHMHHIRDSNYISSFFSTELNDGIISFSQLRDLLLMKNNKIYSFVINQDNNKESILDQIQSFISEERIESENLFEICKAFSCLYDNDKTEFTKKEFSIFEDVIFKLEPHLNKYLEELINSDYLNKNKKCVTEFLNKNHNLVYQSDETSLNEDQYFELRILLFSALSEMKEINLFDGFYPNCFYELYRLLQFDNSKANMNEESKNKCKSELDSILNGFMVNKENLLGFIYIFRENWNKTSVKMAITDMRKKLFPEISNIDNFAIQFVKEYIDTCEIENDILGTMELFISLFDTEDIR